MLEIIVAIATLAIIIMAWSRVSSALDWTGDRIGETSDMISDLTVSGGKQTARGVLISHDSLRDTALDSSKKEGKRVQARKDFFSKLDADQKKSVEAHEKYMDKYINR